MAVNYVKFIRGTPTAFAKLSQKDNDTLYFISETNSQKGYLYLGNKLISESITNFEDLNNILLDNLQDKHLLSYDANNEKWVNKSIIDAIGIMTGAKNNAQGGVGLVPAPGIGQDGLFLRGDGVWATPVGGGSNVDVKPDEKTISFSNDGVTIALKDFGIKYYKYIPEANGVKAHYKAQIVDASNPWKENLEAKVTIDENGQFVLGWFEQNLELNGQIEKLTSKVNTIDELAKQNATEIITIKSSVVNIADLLNNKADASNVYTKTEVDAKILEAGHLTRKTFGSLEEAKTFADSISNPEAYIYMIASTPNKNDKYAEYLYIDGVLEMVGSWDVNLENYATKEEINVVSSQVTNLETLLNSKADKDEVSALSNTVGTISTKVENLENFMNSEYFEPVTEIKNEVSVIREAITWQEL